MTKPTGSLIYTVEKGADLFPWRPLQSIFTVFNGVSVATITLVLIGNLPAVIVMLVMFMAGMAFGHRRAIKNR